MAISIPSPRVDAPAAMLMGGAGTRAADAQPWVLCVRLRLNGMRLAFVVARWMMLL